MKANRDDSFGEVRMSLPGARQRELPIPKAVIQLSRPQVDRHLTSLQPLERAGAVLKFSVLRAEHWISPSGHLRRYLCQALRIWLYVLVAALITPSITAVLHQITGWTVMSAEIVRNISAIPLGLGKFLLACFAVVVLLKALLRR